MPFRFGGTFASFEPTKDQISSHWTRLAAMFLMASSWYISQAAPTSTSSFVTVLMLTSASLEAARRLAPSVRRPRICTRFSIDSLFILNVMPEYYR